MPKTKRNVIQYALKPQPWLALSPLSLSLSRAIPQCWMIVQRYGRRLNERASDRSNERTSQQTNYRAAAAAATTTTTTRKFTQQQRVYKCLLICKALTAQREQGIQVSYIHRLASFQYAIHRALIVGYNSVKARNDRRPRYGAVYTL